MHGTRITWERNASANRTGVVVAARHGYKEAEEQNAPDVGKHG